MKTCPFCAEEIQDAAIVCKHCGRDLPAAAADTATDTKPASNSKAGLGCAVIVLLIMGGCGVLMLLPESAEQRREREQSFARAATATLCEEAVTRRLRSPGSAKFPFGNVSAVTRESGNRHQMLSYVDSQNAFGATLRTRFRCVVEGSGDRADGYKVVDIALLE